MPLPSGRRRALATAAVLVAATLPAALIASPSQADDDATVTVVGTSDVYDSNLVQAVLKPGFEAAYPQYTLKYVSKGTGAAITFAKEGTASAMVVHAAALENQFVADGYSAEPYGRAIFWGDYVLAGNTDDPVGIKPAGDFSHDIVGDFEKIAAAGADGNAHFVSRGGTPGTTVQEHAIWARTTGVQLCDVSAANGGGKSPSTVSGACPTPIPYPAWYHATGLTQGPNVVNANVCNYAGPKNNCYVMTDRGTFNNLQDQDETYPSVQSANRLTLVTFGNRATAAVPDGETLLVNSFHAYAVNPAKFAGNPNVRINSAGAKAFLDWTTSPAGQAAVGRYLSRYGSPFVPSASPATTASTLPTRIKAGQSVTVTGNITNVVPGTPKLGGVTVSLTASPLSNLAAPTRTVATGVTDANGSYSITYKPTASSVHSISVPDITRIQDASLNFGDTLTGITKPVGVVQVQSAVKLTSVTTKGGRVRIKGTLSPKVTGSKGYLSLYTSVTKNGKKKTLKYKAKKTLKNGATTFDVRFKLPKGTSRVQIAYTNKGDVLTSRSSVRNARIR